MSTHDTTSHTKVWVSSTIAKVFKKSVTFEQTSKVVQILIEGIQKANIFKLPCLEIILILEKKKERPNILFSLIETQPFFLTAM